MVNGKIQYAVQPDEEAFLKEFEGFWTDEQFDLVTSGFKSTFTIDPLMLPDPATVDPKTDPVTARNILLNPKSTFRIFEQPFVLPLLPYFAAAKQQVPPEIEVLKNQYDLYLVKYGVDVNPQGKEKFAKVDLHLDYPMGQGFFTLSMIPDSELVERFSAKSKITVGLDPHLNFKVPDINLKPGVEVGGGMRLAVESDLLIHWEYTMLTANVIALGAKGSYVQWIIEKPKQMVGSVELATVLCAHKGLKELPVTVTGYYRLERGIWWWQRETTVDINSIEPINVHLPD
jgi:hypothetical protein